MKTSHTKIKQTPNLYNLMNMQTVRIGIWNRGYDAPH